MQMIDISLFAFGILVMVSIGSTLAAALLAIRRNKKEEVKEKGAKKTDTIEIGIRINEADKKKMDEDIEAIRAAVERMQEEADAMMESFDRLREAAEAGLKNESDL